MKSRTVLKFQTATQTSSSSDGSSSFLPSTASNSLTGDSPPSPIDIIGQIGHTDNNLLRVRAKNKFSRKGVSPEKASTGQWVSLSGKYPYWSKLSELSGNVLAVTGTKHDSLLSTRTIGGKRNVPGRYLCAFQVSITSLEQTMDTQMSSSNWRLTEHRHLRIALYRKAPGKAKRGTGCS